MSDDEKNQNAPSLSKSRDKPGQEEHIMAGTLRVLYADDEAALLEIGKLFLEEYGDFTVTTALSAPEGIRLLEQEKFDAIISDYQMPGMDGIQFLVKVRAVFGPIPFILFTGRGREEVVIEAINSGVDFYLQKGGEPGAQFAELTHKVQIAVEHHRAAEKIEALNRLYSVLSETNKAIVRIQTKSDFFSEICRILVGTGGFSMAWIGLADPEQKVIRPVASSGYTSGYLDTINISTEDVPHGRGPTGTAYREGKYNFSNDIAGDPHMEPWRENALKRGYRSNAAFPFSLGTKNAGVLSLYAPVCGFFNEQILDLLEELAIDIAFALKTIDDKEDQKRAEGALHESETRFRALVEYSSDIIRILDREGRIVFDTTASERLLSYPPGYTIGRSPMEFIHPDDLGMVKQELSKVYTSTNTGILTKFRIRKADGSYSWVESSGKNLIGVPGIDGVVINTRFIDDRKKAEDELLKNAEELHAAFEEITATEEELRANLDELTRQDRMLRESEEKFKTLFEGAGDAIFIMDQNVFLDCNKKTEEIFRGKRDEIIGRSPGDFSPELQPDGQHSAEKMKEMIDAALSGNAQFFEWVHLHYDGTPFNAEVSLNRVMIRETRCLQAIVRDITDRKKAEDALRESECKMRDIISFLPDATFVIDKNGVVIAWNRAMEEMTGEPAEKMIGKGNYEYSLPFYKERRPITIDLVLHDDPAVVAKYPVMKKEGKSLFSEIFIPHLNNGRGAHLWFTASPLFDADGNLTGAIESIREITERKEAQDALQHQTEFQKSIITNARVWMSVLDPKGNILLWNTAAEEISGYRSEEVIGRNEIWKMLYPDKEYRKQITDTITRIIREKKYLENFETTIRSKQGNEKVISWNTKGIPYPDGRPTDYIVIGVDVTDRQLAEDALRGANKKLTLLSSITRHDINNQLLLLNVFLGYLHRKVTDPALEEDFAKITLASSKISSLIQFTAEYEQISFKAPVWQNCHTLVATAAKQAPLGKVTVKNDLPAEIEVFADPLIVKVFYNLMDNAVRHGGKITTIRLFIEERDGVHVVVCEDDGDGIVAEEKERIFERGFGKNTGLGLALSRDTLDITGITISEIGEPGKGARFEMVIPKGSWRITGGGA